MGFYFFWLNTVSANYQKFLSSFSFCSPEKMELSKYNIVTAPTRDNCHAKIKVFTKFDIFSTFDPEMIKHAFMYPIPIQKGLLPSVLLSDSEPASVPVSKQTCTWFDENQLPWMWELSSRPNLHICSPTVSQQNRVEITPGLGVR